MTDDRAVIQALRNSIDIAMFCEAAGVESCSNAIVIRALNLSAMGTTLIVALDLAWRVGLPIDTPASTILQAAHDRLVCQELETAI